MNYRIKLRSSSVKELQSLQSNLRERVRIAIDALADEPRPSGCKKLKGFSNLFRIRVSDIRVLYSIHDDTLIIEIIKIGNRRDVYKKK